MKLTHPSYPNITLENLLRRRKTTLARFVESTGVTTYELLVERCARMGVTPPLRETFEAIVPPTQVSSPTEGVVIVPAPDLVDERGEAVDELPVLSDPFPQTGQKKKRNR